MMSVVTEEIDLLDVSDVASRIADNWDEWNPESEWPELSVTAVVAGAALALCVVAGIFFATRQVRHPNIPGDQALKTLSRRR